jgi:hypothetical protein
MKLSHRQKLAVIILAIEVIPLILMFPDRATTGYLASGFVLLGLTAFYVWKEPEGGR